MKGFALTGLPVQCLDKRTVAVVRRGRFTVTRKGAAQSFRVSQSLRVGLGI